MSLSWPSQKKSFKILKKLLPEPSASSANSSDLLQPSTSLLLPVSCRLFCAARTNQSCTSTRARCDVPPIQSDAYLVLLSPQSQTPSSWKMAQILTLSSTKPNLHSKQRQIGWLGPPNKNLPSTVSYLNIIHYKCYHRKIVIGRLIINIRIRISITVQITFFWNFWKTNFCTGSASSIWECAIV